MISRDDPDWRSLTGGYRTPTTRRRRSAGCAPTGRTLPHGKNCGANSITKARWAMPP